MDTPAPTVTLGQHSETLRAPSPFFVESIMHSREELDAMPPALITAECMVCLAECWPTDRKWPAELRPRPWRASARVDVIGQEIFDGLRAAKISRRQIIDAGYTAQRWAVACGGVTDDESLREVTAFSEAQGGAA